jgi:hypothetical protein
MTSELLSSYKILKSLVINENLNKKFLYYRKQFKSSFFKVVNNNKHLFIINDVAPFYRF